MRLKPYGAAFAIALATVNPVPARAGETVKIAYIDPLSGPLAETGLLGEQHFRLAIDRANAAQAAGPGRRLELVALDNAVSPAQSVALLHSAIDGGIRYVTQGLGSDVTAALVDAIEANNRHAPGKSVLLLNYAAVDPALTNAHCSWWHFRFDADSDMKMRMLTDYLVEQKSIHRVFILNPDYSFGVSVQKAAEAMLAGRRPDLQIVGAERMPLGQVEDFAPYIAKIQAAGADAVLTGNWGQDLQLLVKAAAAAGYKGTFFTYYLGDEVLAQAAGPGARGDVQVSEWADNVPGLEDLTAAFEAQFHRSFTYWRIVNEIDMLAAAMREARSSDPAAVGRALAGMTHDTPLGESVMRADNHQLLQPMFVSQLEPNEPHVYAGLDMGFETVERAEAEGTRMPTTCKFKDRP